MGSETSERRAFTDLCARFGQDERARLTGAIAARETTLARLGGEIRAVSRELLRSRQRLAALDLVDASDRARFERDYEALLALPKVAGVEVAGDRLRITTAPISVGHDGQEYRLGRFSIDLDLTLVDEIRITNLDTPARDAWDHPHVQAGLPCLGSLREGCEQLLGQLDLVPLVSILIQFLEAYDPPSAYTPIERWATVPA